MSKIGFLLGILWCIFLCIIFIFLCVKLYNKIKNKTESKRFQAIFTFLLKSSIPFFIVLFILGNKSIMFADPKFYFCAYYNISNKNKKIYNENLESEIMYSYKDKSYVLSNGYKLKYEIDKISFFNGSRQLKQKFRRLKLPCYR